MQLRDDDTLGAIDDEGAVVGHQRQIAKIDLLLLDVLDRLLGARRLLVEDDETDLDAQRRSIGQATELALFNVETGLGEPVGHVLERRIARVTGNGEYRFKGRMQAYGITLELRRIGLEKRAVRVELDSQQIWHIQDSRLLAEILADALLFREGIGHLFHLDRQNLKNAKLKRQPAPAVSRDGSLGNQVIT